MMHHHALLLVLISSLFLGRADAVCDASPDDEDLPIGSNGFILSDRDGVGSVSQYRHNQDCEWLIVCNPGDFVGIYDLQHRFGSGDRLEVRDGFTTLNVLRTFTLSSTRVIRANFQRSRLSVRFVTDASLAGNGFTLRYMCMSGSCSARESNFANFTNGRNYSGAVSGSIRSDLDGLSSSTLFLPRESCDWTFHCDPSLNFTHAQLLVQSATVFRQDNLTISGSDGESPLVISGIQTLRRLVSLPQNGSAKVSFASGDGDTSSAAGFTLNYACRRGRCSSPSAWGDPFTNATGTIMSDVDGELSANNYLTGENCRWQVRCQDPLHTTTIVRFYGRTNQHDVITIRGATTNETIFTTNTGVVDVFGAFARGERGIDVIFTSTSTGAPGFDIEWECTARQCTSVTPSTLNSSQGEILSDSDGALSTLVLAKESCSWKIECPASHSGGIVLSAWGLLRSDDDLRASVRDEFGAHSDLVFGLTTTTYETNPFTAWFTRGRSNATISLTTEQSGTGITLRYACLLAPNSKCTSPQSTAVEYRTSTSGSFVASLDGLLSPWRYFNDESCTWRVACPASENYNFMLWSVSASLASGDRFSVRNATNGVSLANFTGTVAGHLVASSDVFLDFTSDAIGIGNGAAANYACRRQRCSAASGGDILTAVSGTILTDQDGTGTITQYLPGEECMWTIRCPSGEPYVLVTTATRTSSSNDYVWINHGSSTYTQYTTRTVTQYFPGPELYVGFTALWYGGGNGATIDYTCRPSLCSVNESYLTGINGTLLSDSDGVGSVSRIASSDRCRHTITCPAGYAFIAIEASFSISSGDSIVVANENWSERVIITSSTLRSFNNVLSTGGRPIAVLFNSSTTTRPSGFTLMWRCHMGNRCPSISAPLQSSEAAALVEVEAVHTKSFLTTSIRRADSCSWYGVCPPDAPYLFLRAVWPSATDTEEWRVQRNDSSEVLSSSFTDRRLPSADSISSNVSTFRIDFSSSSQSASAYTARWTWTCSRSRCQAPTDGAVFKWNRTAGISTTLSSSRVNGWSTFPGEQCTWAIHCAAGEYVTLHNLVTILEGGNVVTIYDETPESEALVFSPGVKRVLRRYSSTQSTTTIRLPTRYASLLLEGRSHSGSNVRYLSFSFSCAPSACSSSSSPTSPQVLTSASGTISVEPLAASWCSYAIRCPAPMTAIFFNLSHSFTSTTSVENSAQVSLQTSANTGFNATPSVVRSTTTSPLTSATFSPLAVDFTFGLLGDRGAAVLRYECAESLCQSPNASLSGSPPTPISAPARLVTDTDGALTSHVSPAYSACAWRVACPSSSTNGDGMRFIQLTTTSTSEFRGATVFFPDALSGQRTSMRVEHLGSSFSTPLAHTVFLPALNGTGSAPYAEIHTGEGSGAIVAGTQMDTGATFDVACVTAACEATSPASGSNVVMEFGSIDTRFLAGSEGASSRPYASNQRCSWTVRCPMAIRARDGIDARMHFVIDGSMDTSDSVVYFDMLQSATSSELVRSSEYSFTRTQSSNTVVTGWLDWRIRYETKSSTGLVGGGYAIRFVCGRELTPVPGAGPPTFDPENPDGRGNSGSSAGDLEAAEVAGIVVGSVMGVVVIASVVGGIFVAVVKGAQSRRGTVDPVTGRPVELVATGRSPMAAAGGRADRPLTGTVAPAPLFGDPHQHQRVPMLPSAPVALPAAVSDGASPGVVLGWHRPPPPTASSAPKGPADGPSAAVYGENASHAHRFEEDGDDPLFDPFGHTAASDAQPMPPQPLVAGSPSFGGFATASQLQWRPPDPTTPLFGGAPGGASNSSPAFGIHPLGVPSQSPPRGGQLF